MGAVASQPVLCGLPGCTRRCYDDGRVVHPYCGRTHAKQAASIGLVPGGQPSDIGTTCQLHGCSRPRFFDPAKNLTNDFCSRSHANEACANRHFVRSGGGVINFVLRWWRILFPGGRQSQPFAPGPRPKPAPQSRVEQVFRGGTTGDTDFTLSVLTQAHPKYSSLRHQFISKWIIPGTPRVLRILEVKVPSDTYRTTAAYKEAKGNGRRRFHGTSCSAQCNFFVDLKGKPCSSKECNVCNICTHGFVMRDNVRGTARRANYRRRYGEGLYFSSVSGKSNDYAQQSEKVGSDGKKVRCMFVANVTAGNAYLTQQVSLGQDMCPPAGYDSVVGEVGSGLLHDELVVYKDEAAIPSYLIVYALP